MTSNKPFGRWGEVFGDDVVAAAMIDRLVHHAEVIALKGDSYRLKDRDLGRVPPRQQDRSEPGDPHPASPPAAQTPSRNESRNDHGRHMPGLRPAIHPRRPAPLVLRCLPPGRLAPPSPQPRPSRRRPRSRRPHPADTTIYQCPECGQRYLGQQRCDDCGTFCRRIGPGGPCPHCDEPVAIKDLTTIS